MYNILNNLPGRTFKCLFIPGKNNYLLRSEQEFIIQKVSTALKGKNPLEYFGTITWNSIPGDIRNTESNNEFQKME